MPGAKIKAPIKGKPLGNQTQQQTAALRSLADRILADDTMGIQDCRHVQDSIRILETALGKAWNRIRKDGLRA